MKHSRLSMSIDFGDRWLGKACSEAYFEEIKTVFDHLAEQKQQRRKWSEVEDKDTAMYMPILRAFRSELLRLAADNPLVVAQNLATYLVGKMDYYKVIKLEHLTSVQAFNLRGNLNQAQESTKPPVKLNRLKLPSRIIELDFKRGAGETTTLLLVCDEAGNLFQDSQRQHIR